MKYRGRYQKLQTTFFTTACIYDPKKAIRAVEMMSVERVAIFWVVNASSGEKSCLQFSIPTGSGAGGEGGVLHSLKARLITDGVLPGESQVRGR